MPAKKGIRLGTKKFKGVGSIYVFPETGEDGVKQPAYTRMPTATRESAKVQRIMSSVAKLKLAKYKDSVTIDESLYNLISSITGNPPETYGFSKGATVKGRLVAKLAFILRIGAYKGVEGAEEALKTKIIEKYWSSKEEQLKYRLEKAKAKKKAATA